MIETLGSWIIQLISAFGYGGIFILMMLESALIPIPSEVTMPFSGSLVAAGTFTFWFVVAAGTFGNLAGSILAYWLGAWGQETVVRKVLRKYGKYVLISEREYEQSEHWFRKHGEHIVFVSRVLPVIRTFISLPAGIARMNLMKFCAYTAVGSFIWSYALTYIGVLMGNNWRALEGYFRKFDLLIVLAGLLTIFWYVRRALHHRRTLTRTSG